MQRFGPSHIIIIKHNYYEFQTVTVETRGYDFISFISELWRKISKYSGDPYDSRYLIQRVIVLVQRYKLNSILFCETFPTEDEIDTQPFQPGFSFFLFLAQGSILPGVKILK